MSQKLINHSPDLLKLQNEGYEIEIKDNHLLVHHVPYITSLKEIKYGTLVSVLTLAGEKIGPPNDHVIHFQGEYPCNKDGSIITAIQNQDTTKKLTENIVINHSFSNKPANGYKDQCEKVTRYIEIISAPAKSMDDSVKEKTFKTIESNDEESVFNYPDSNSSRSGTYFISSKLKNKKIAIIGLGGTGSYILDLIAKTPVKEIHLFDGDDFHQHNAFRAPGAPSIEIFNNPVKKVDYFKSLYLKMHKYVIPHSYYIDTSHVEELSGMDFVFICLDKGEVKKTIIDYLINNKQSFIDVGMGVFSVDDSLSGIIRVTSSTEVKRDHIEKRISFSVDGNNEYTQNIQIADLNALNAALAVIKWKKMMNYYNDRMKEYHTTYTIDRGQLLNEDN